MENHGGHEKARIKKAIGQIVRDLKIMVNKEALKVHGFKGLRIFMLTNHFKVNDGNIEEYFFHYNVSISYEDGHPVDGKGCWTKSN